MPTASRCAAIRMSGWEMTYTQLMRLILVTLLALGIASAQLPADHFSLGFVNCRGWHAMNSDMRLGYLIGWSDASRATADKDMQSSFSHGPSYGEYQKGVVELCAPPENAAIAVWGMITIFTKKVMGASEKDITFELEFDRQYFSQPLVPPPPQQTGGKK
jgi:hypothetical protein